MKNNVKVPLASCLVFVPFVLLQIGCRTVRQEVEHIHSLGDRLKADPSDKQSLAKLKGYLNHRDELLRAQAVSALGNAGAKHLEVLGDKVVPLLIERLKDRENVVRRYAVVHLGDFGKKAEPAVAGLVDVLSNYAGTDTAMFAANVLGDLGPAALPAVPELIRSLDQRSNADIYRFAMAEAAARALFKLSPLAPEHVTEMLKRVESLSGESLSFVALAILKSQPRNPSASEALARVLTGQTPLIVFPTLQEVEKLPPDLFDRSLLVPALAKCSQSTDRDVRELGTEQLARFKDHGGVVLQRK